MSADLLAFLRARLDEDEQIARAATPGPWKKAWGEVRLGEETWTRLDNQSKRDTAADAEHIVRFDPACVLVEVEAKRALLDDLDHGGGDMAEARWLVIRHLASVYAHHLDYREEWRP